MRMSFNMKIPLVAIAVTIALSAGCGQSPPSAAGPAPAAKPPAAAQVPQDARAPATPAASRMTAAASASAAEPALTSMRLATTSSKAGVPVDLRYQFDGDAQTGQPVTLHLAAVPRVEGSNLVVSIKEVPGLVTATGALSEQKASATTAYRRQMPVTKLAGGPTELRVLVTMDLPEGSAFGWYSVPLDGAPVETKQAPVKSR